MKRDLIFYLFIFSQVTAEYKQNINKTEYTIMLQ